MKKGTLSILSGLTGAAVGAGLAGRRMLNKRQEIQEISNKHLELFLMTNQWIKVKQEGKSLVEYFKKTGYKNIAVYGMSYAGETFMNELKDTDVQVAYGIDKNTNAVYPGMRIVSLEDRMEEVDAIVVTAITFFDEIKERLKEKTNCPIISLEDVIYEV